MRERDLYLKSDRFVKSIPFNDLERSLELLRPIKHDLACIIVEPLLAGSGCVPPVEGYLQGLEEFSHNNESLFILDEIVTGFRLSIQGAAQKFKLNPDLFTLGEDSRWRLTHWSIVWQKRNNVSLRSDPASSKRRAMCYWWRVLIRQIL